MSQLREALDAILTVEWRHTVPAPSDTAAIGHFLEQAALEISDRERSVAERERAVSAREAAVELRESEISAQVKALASVQRVRTVLDHNPLPEVKRVGWFKR